MPWQRMHSLHFAEVRIFIFHSTVTKYTFQYVKEIIFIWFAMQWSRNTQKTLGLPLFVIMSIRLFQHYNQDVHDFALLLLMQCMSQNDLNMSLLLKGKFYTSFFQLALSIFNLVLSKLEMSFYTDVVALLNSSWSLHIVLLGFLSFFLIWRDFVPSICLFILKVLWH